MGTRNQGILDVGINLEEKTDMDLNIETYSSIFIYPFFFSQDKYESILKLILSDNDWLLDISNPTEPQERRHLRYFLPYVQKFMFPCAFWEDKSIKKFGRKVYYKDNKELLDIGGEKRNKFIINAALNYMTKEQQLLLLAKNHIVRWRYKLDDKPVEYTLTNDKNEINSKFSWRKVSLLIYSTGVGLLLLDTKLSSCSSLPELTLFNRSFKCLETLDFGSRAALISGTPLENIIKNKFLNTLIIKELLDDSNFGLGQTFLFHCCFAGLSRSQELSLDNEYIQKFLLSNKLGSQRFEHLGSCYEFSKNGFAAVVSAHQNGPSNENHLRYWRTYYMDFYLHSLYLRLSLIKFSRELSEIDQLLGNSKKLENLHKSFLEFTNKAWFYELTNAEFGHLLWKRWQTVMEIEILYNEVKTQLYEFNEFNSQLRKRHFNWLVNVVTLLGTSLALTIGIFQMGIFEVKPKIALNYKHTLILSFFLMVIMTVFGFCLYYSHVVINKITFLKRLMPVRFKIYLDKRRNKRVKLPQINTNNHKT